MSEFVLWVQLHTRPDQRERFLELALENATASLAEPGCRQFDVIVDADDPDHIAFYEVYDDREAFERHQATDHFKRYLEIAVPLLASRERAFFDRILP